MENQNNNNTNILPVVSSDVKPETFNFNGAEVRVMMKDGEPWFVAKDVCSTLEIQNGRDTVNKCLDEDERGVATVYTRGGNQKMVIISEAGLYSLTLRSRSPKAKPFKRWVTHEVLPAIRKTGGYLISREDESPEEIMARALLVAKETIDRQKRQIEQDRPKVQFADAVTASETCITVGELAKLISQSTGYKTGRDRLFDWLRKAGWLISYGSSRNMPSQRGMERGFFVIHERTGQSGNGNPPIIFKTTKVTGKGQQYFLEYFNRENPL